MGRAQEGRWSGLNSQTAESGHPNQSHEILSPFLRLEYYSNHLIAQCLERTDQVPELREGIDLGIAKPR